MDHKKMVEAAEAPQKIAEIQFALMSPAEMQKVSEFHVWSPEMYQMGNRKPVPDGVLDPRLGVIDKLGHCKTCNCKVVAAWHFVNSCHKGS